MKVVRIKSPSTRETAEFLKTCELPKSNQNCCRRISNYAQPYNYYSSIHIRYVHICLVMDCPIIDVVVQYTMVADNKKEISSKICSSQIEKLFISIVYIYIEMDGRSTKARFVACKKCQFLPYFKEQFHLKTVITYTCM